MDKLCIYIAYNGKWTKDNKYLDHETKLILVNDEITFEGLVEKIFQFLKPKKGEKTNIWFDTKLETSKGMLVTNDEEVTTCIYLLKNDSNFKTSRFIVDIPRRNPLPAKKIEPIKALDYPLNIEPIKALDYPLTEEKSEETGETTTDDKTVRRSARLSKKRKRYTRLSKKGKRSAPKRDNLPTVVLGDDASLDEIAVGSLFEDKRSVKKCFLDIAAKHHLKFKPDRSTRRRYYLKCCDDECSWYMHSSQVRDSTLFKITKLEKKHTCSGDVLSEQRHVTAKVISDYIIELVRDTNTEIRPPFVAEEVRKKYGMEISYTKAWRATQLARAALGIPEQALAIEENAETGTDSEKDDLPTVVLREDALLDEIVVGSIFEDKENLKNCFSNIAIKHHFKYKVSRTNYRRYNLKCFDDKCSWYLHSSRVHDSSLFRINKFDKTHSCSPDVLSDQKHLTYKVISDYIIELLHDTGEEITPKFVVEEMKSRYGLNISYHKAWRAIQLALGVARESPELIEEPELCPTCLHLTDGNVETFTDDEGDEQIFENPIGNLETFTDFETNDQTNPNPVYNVETCTDVKLDDQTNPSPVGNLKTCTDAEMDDLTNLTPTDNLDSCTDVVRDDQTNLTPTDNLDDQTNLTPTDNLDTCTDVARDDQTNPIPIDNLEICTDVQMDDQGNPNPIGNLETCRDFERNGQTSPKPIDSLGTWTDLERNDQINPNPIGNFETCANIEMHDQTNPNPIDNLKTCAGVEKDDHTNPKPTA